MLTHKKEPEVTSGQVKSTPSADFALIDKLSSGAAICSGIALLGMVLNVTADVLSRTFLDITLPGTLEMVTFVWLPIAVFLGLPYLEAKGEHIRVSIISERLAGKAAGVLGVCMSSAVVIIAAVLLIFSIEAAWSATEIGQAAIGGAVVIPIWPAKILMAIGVGLFLAQCIASFKRALKKARLEKGLQLTPSFLVAMALIAVSVLLMVLIAFAELPRNVLGLLVILLMLALMGVGIPISLSMIVASGFGILKLTSYAGLSSAMRELLFSSTAQWSLSVIPTFVIMGIALWKSGLTGLAYDAAVKWLGRLPGGLAIGTNLAGAGLAAASGSSVGISYALGRVAIPEMLKHNYSPKLATGVVATAGTLGQLIPQASS